MAFDPTRHRESAGPDDDTTGQRDDSFADPLAGDTAAGFRHRAESVLESMGDGVVCTDRDGRVIYLNAAAESLTGCSRVSATLQPLGHVLRVISRDTRTFVPCPAPAPIAPGQSPILHHGIVLRPEGETPVEYTVAPVRDPQGQADGAVIVLRDVGAAIETSRLMSHMAQHDAVTGLPNRFLLRDRLGSAMALAQRRRKRLAVGFLDLDGFKAVNDSLGHLAADRLLRSVASRLQGALRRSDTVCRYGGDEFVIVLPEIEHAFDVAGVGVKILLAMAPPHVIDGSEIVLTASLGVALYPDHGQTADALIANADAAMYAAKRAGPGRWSLFDIGGANP